MTGLLLGTPALAQTNVADTAAVDRADRSVAEPEVAAYLRARVADADGQVALAASDYDAALGASSNDPVVAIHAYREAVRAGDYALADRAAAVLARKGVLPSDAPLLALAAAARANDRAAADRALTALEATPLKILSAPLHAWAALEWKGDPTAALAVQPGDAVARRFVSETRALLLLAQGRSEEGVAALRPLLGNDQSSTDTRIAAARLLIARGDRNLARALLIGDAPPVVALRERPRARIEPGLAFGLSWLLTRVASDLALGNPTGLSYTLVQSALRADPGDDRARLLLAGALSKDGATDRALAVLDQVDARGIHATQAMAGRVQILADAGRTQEALRLAQPLAAARAADPADVQRLADLYLRLDRPGDAAPLYRRLAERAGADWTDWLQYGAALDRGGDWPAARGALEQAYARAPDQPLVLNYLGYALIEHGERMPEAQAMLERAARAEPTDAAITDSLGWALFRRGDVPRALPLVQRAVAADPNNAEIGEHLGDIYWRVGRRYEARYAWTAARATAETPNIAQRLSGKIANGL
ncbi:tetratricopeptide repeat protein [Sphingomonas sp. Mn802worker]|uniref:tetratricopeptide repeat protein n=1 Tax=Sphingomonas sp. Mn802worker TaxID=629773 RepID=UPI00039D6F7C|nr:tetratricopeptide repeat protein [Sphingomonas sp. Mn802worker]